MQTNFASLELKNKPCKISPYKFSNEIINVLNIFAISAFVLCRINFACVIAGSGASTVAQS